MYLLTLRLKSFIKPDSPTLSVVYLTRYIQKLDGKTLGKFKNAKSLKSHAPQG